MAHRCRVARMREGSAGLSGTVCANKRLAMLGDADGARSGLKSPPLDVKRAARTYVVSTVKSRKGRENVGDLRAGMPAFRTSPTSSHGQTMPRHC